MGNCTGVFGACVGEDPQAIKKIDQKNIALALQANNKDLLGDGGLGNGGLQSPDSYNLGGGNTGPINNNVGGIVGSQGNFSIKQQ